jgi:transcription initiation factor TFIIIB Brf1 subunit/transcription initiation factor TFIIB
MNDRISDEIIGRAALQRLKQDEKRVRQLFKREREVKALQEELRQCVDRAGLERYSECRELAKELLRILNEPWQGTSWNNDS